MILLTMLACLTREQRIAHLWCDEVAKCDPAAECWVPEWFEDPRCGACEADEFAFQACLHVLTLQRDRSTCMLDSTQYEPALADCENTFFCPEGAPAECTIDADMPPMRRP